MSFIKTAIITIIIYLCFIIVIIITDNNIDNGNNKNNNTVNPIFYCVLNFMLQKCSSSILHWTGKFFKRNSAAKTTVSS